MTSAKGWLRLLVVLTSACLLCSCVGLGVMLPHTSDQTIPDRESNLSWMRTRAGILEHHGESALLQAGAAGEHEQVLVDTGHTNCGVLLLVLPLLPKICRTQTSYELDEDAVVSIYQRSTRFYGLVCTFIFPVLGKNSFCVLFPTE
ncbi:hypothetical protein ACUNV4_16035 [Granulosicoccus sp. 3-233]